MQKDYLSKQLSEDLVYLKIRNTRYLLAIDELFNNVEISHEGGRSNNTFSSQVRTSYNYAKSKNIIFRATFFEDSIYHHLNNLLFLSVTNLKSSNEKFFELRTALAQLDDK